jgi:two-component system chemotaxis sensor kinase CheA
MGEAHDKKRILVVDDSALVRDTVADILRVNGYNVGTVPDGDVALSMLRSGEPFDLVLSDVQMPNMGGVELTRAIRADKTLFSLPIVLMSSYVSEHDMRRHLLAGANDVVQKPVVMDVLLQVVKKTLEIKDKRTRV